MRIERIYIYIRMLECENSTATQQIRRHLFCITTTKLTRFARIQIDVIGDFGWKSCVHQVIDCPASASALTGGLRCLRSLLRSHRCSGQTKQHQQQQHEHRRQETGTVRRRAARVYAHVDANNYDSDVHAFRVLCSAATFGFTGERFRSAPTLKHVRTQLR